MRILAVNGSLRRGSHNAALLRAAAQAAPARIELVPYEGLGSIPPYNEDEEAGELHPAVCDLRASIASADAVLFATPEYNGSVPGQLKNAVDWASRPYRESSLAGKPVAVIGASTGFLGGIAAQEDLRKVLRVAGARVSDAGLAVPDATRRLGTERGDLPASLRAGLTGVLTALSASAGRELRAA